MRYELAPMEGLTTYIYRRVYHRHFTPADKYFTPFLAPNMNCGLGSRENREVLPENNTGMHLVPQLLTNRADYFLSACRTLQDLGYEEINLNLGCPSGTVVAKGKGSGFLSDPEGLKRFLDEIFSSSPLRISIKTRIGRYADSEWPALLALYRQYPCTELIVHPRIQKDFYKNIPRISAYAAAAEGSPFPVVYNGDLFTRADVAAFSAAFPSADTVMVGRGVLFNPWLLGGTPDKTALGNFFADLLETYRSTYGVDAQALSKMKGIWNYQIQLFTNYAPYLKIIRKTRQLEEYRATVASLLHNEAIIPDARFAFEK